MIRLLLDGSRTSLLYAQVESYSILWVSLGILPWCVSKNLKVCLFYVIVN